MILIPIAILINFVLSKLLTRFIDLEDKFFNILYIFVIGFVILFTKITGFEIGSYFNLSLSNESWLKVITLILLCTHLVIGDGLQNGRKLLASLVFLFSPTLEFLLVSFLVFYILEAFDDSTESPKGLVRHLPLSLLLFLFIGKDFTLVLSSVGIILIYILNINSKFLRKGFYSNFVFITLFSSLLLFLKLPSPLVSLVVGAVFVEVVINFKKLISRTNINLEEILELILKLTILLPIFGDEKIFYLMLSFILVCKTLLCLSGDSKNLSWYLFAFLFLFSPPFGLGYIFKTYLYRKALSSGLLDFSLVLVMIALITILSSISFIKNVLPNWQNIKDKKYIFSKLGFTAIGINIFVSILFIPLEWNTGIGSLFFKWVNLPLSPVELPSLGYYLFWLEFVFGLVCLLIIFKIGSREVEEKIARISQISVNFSRTKIAKPRESIKYGQNDLRELVEVLNPSLERLTNSSFIIVLLFMFSLLILGVS